MEYTIVEREDYSLFIEIVNEYLGYDWKLQGGVSITCYEKQSDDGAVVQVFRYAQAFVK